MGKFFHGRTQRAFMQIISSYPCSTYVQHAWVSGVANWVRSIALPKFETGRRRKCVKTNKSTVRLPPSYFDTLSRSINGEVGNRPHELAIILTSNVLCSQDEPNGISKEDPLLFFLHKLLLNGGGGK